MSLQKSNSRPQFLAPILMASVLTLGSPLLSIGSARADVPFNPPGGSAPKGRGGASRGDMTCMANPAEFTRHFMPLTPTHSNYGLTVAQHPSVFVSIPASSAQKVFFNLKDEAGKVHYQTTLPITNTHGIVRLDIPTSAPPLVVGQRYQWGVAILCTGKLKPDSPFVSSWIQRIDPPASLLKQSGKATSLDQVYLYGTHGIWYDLLATLADLRQQKPNDPTVVSNWKQLLSSVGLGDIATEPLN